MKNIIILQTWFFSPIIFKHFLLSQIKDQFNFKIQLKLNLQSPLSLVQQTVIIQVALSHRTVKSLNPGVLPARCLQSIEDLVFPFNAETLNPTQTFHKGISYISIHTYWSFSPQKVSVCMGVCLGTTTSGKVLTATTHSKPEHTTQSCFL